MSNPTTREVDRLNAAIDRGNELLDAALIENRSLRQQLAALTTDLIIEVAATALSSIDRERIGGVVNKLQILAAATRAPGAK